MKLYHYPGSCSTGIQVLLHVIGEPFEVEVVDLPSGAQKSAAFRAVSPKGKVPTLLRDDGTVLTEFQTIAMWLGRSFPQAGLLPDDPEGQTRVLEVLDFMVGSVHMRGFTFVLATGKFLSDPAGQAALQDHGRGIVTDGMAALSGMLGDKDYLFGDMTVADGALFYLCVMGGRGGFDLPDNLRAFHDRIIARPGMAAALGVSPSGN